MTRRKKRARLDAPVLEYQSPAPPAPHDGRMFDFFLDRPGVSMILGGIALFALGLFAIPERSILCDLAELAGSVLVSVGTVYWLSGPRWFD